MIRWFLNLFRNESSGTYSPARWLVDWISGSSESASGIRVTAKKALSFSSVFQAVSLISGDVAKLPFHLVRKLSEGGKERAISHPAFYLVRRKPCPEMAAFHFIRTLTAHALLRGNGYAYIFRDGRQKPTEILPLDPDSTFPVRESGRLWYVTTVSGEQRKLDPANVLHIRGLCSDGLVGYSVIELAKESIGLGLAAEKFGSTFFGNGSMASGIIEYPGKLDEKIVERIRSTWESMHKGLDKSHRIAVLDAGVKFSQLTIPPEQAQFLSTRKFQRVEIASWFNLPPHKLGDETRTSRASLEQENQSYLESALDPWLVTWEAECWDKLLTEKEKRSGEYAFEFLRLALLRADAKTRSAFYHNALQDGWMNRDEVRERENMNPLPDGQGKKFLVPLNMGPAEDDVEVVEDDSDSPPEDGVLAAHRELIVTAAAKMIRWEIDAVQRLAKKPGEFLQGVDEFYEKHEERIVEALLPSLKAVASVTTQFDATDKASSLASLHCAASRELLLEVAGSATAGNLAALVGEQILGWESRSQSIADELIQTKTLYALAE